MALNPAAVEVDVARFERLAADGAGPALAEAAALYRGDLLAGLGPQGGPFEEWLLTERERLREMAVEVLARRLACVEALRRELGAEPEAETRQLYPLHFGRNGSDRTRGQTRRRAPGGRRCQRCRGHYPPGRVVGVDFEITESRLVAPADMPGTCRN